MMHKAWSSIEEVSYCVSRSFAKFQGHTAQEIVDFYPNWAFPDCNSSLNLLWLWNDAQTWSSMEKVPYCFSRSSIKFQGHTGQKVIHFDPNWTFPDCNLSLNSPKALKWCTKLDVVQKRCSIGFQGHLSNFKVTGDKKITDFHPNWAFWDCNSSLNSHMALKQCTKLNIV